METMIAQGPVWPCLLAHLYNHTFFIILLRYISRLGSSMPLRRQSFYFIVYPPIAGSLLRACATKPPCMDASSCIYQASETTAFGATWHVTSVQSPLCILVYSGASVCRAPGPRPSDCMRATLRALQQPLCILRACAAQLSPTYTCCQCMPLTRTTLVCILAWPWARRTHPCVTQPA